MIYCIAELCNVDLGNAEANRNSLQDTLVEPKMQDNKDTAINSPSPNEPAIFSSHTSKSPIISNPLANLPESLIPQLQPTLETSNSVNDNDCSNTDTTNKNGCAIAIQVDEDYEDEENEDEISETVALTQKFDKNRTKKN